MNVRTILATSGPYDTACFHSQQAVERYMKGFLSWSGRAFPFTHDLTTLCLLCDREDSSLHLHVPEVAALTPYAVTLRYDNEFWPSQQEAREALAVAENVRGAVLARIPSGVHP